MLRSLRESLIRFIDILLQLQESVNVLLTCSIWHDKVIAFLCIVIHGALALVVKIDLTKSSTTAQAADDLG